MNRQRNMEVQLSKIHIINAIEKRVFLNTHHINRHERTINTNLKSNQNILGTLEDMQVHNTKQADRTEENQALLLAEIRKGNESNSQTHTPVNPPTKRPNTTTQKTDTREGQNKRGWKKETILVNDHKLENLVDREDPVRRLIDKKTGPNASVLRPRKTRRNWSSA